MKRGREAVSTPHCYTSLKRKRGAYPNTRHNPLPPPLVRALVRIFCMGVFFLDFLTPLLLFWVVSVWISPPKTVGKCVSLSISFSLGSNDIYSPASPHATHQCHTVNIGAKKPTGRGEKERRKRGKGEESILGSNNIDSSTCTSIAPINAAACNTIHENVAVQKNPGALNFYCSATFLYKK